MPLLKSCSSCRRTLNSPVLRETPAPEREGVRRDEGSNRVGEWREKEGEEVKTFLKKGKNRQENIPQTWPLFWGQCSKSQGQDRLPGPPAACLRAGFQSKGTTIKGHTSPKAMPGLIEEYRGWKGVVHSINIMVRSVRSVVNQRVPPDPQAEPEPQILPW